MRGIGEWEEDGDDKIESDKQAKEQLSLFREGGSDDELMDTGENTR